MVWSLSGVMRLEKLVPKCGTPIRTSDIGAMSADSYVETERMGSRPAGSIFKEKLKMKSRFSVAAFSKSQQADKKMLAFACEHSSNSRYDTPLVLHFCLIVAHRRSSSSGANH
jgi:hypothetical protein